MLQEATRVQMKLSLSYFLLSVHAYSLLRPVLCSSLQKNSWFCVYGSHPFVGVFLLRFDRYADSKLASGSRFSDPAPIYDQINEVQVQIKYSNQF